MSFSSAIVVTFVPSLALSYEALAIGADAASRERLQ